MTLNPPQTTIPFDRAISARTFLRPIAPYLDDPAITELAIVRPGELFTRQAGAWHQQQCPALTYDHLAALANALTVYNKLGTTPILSVVLPDGERGQIIQPPACLEGTIAMNIRKHTQVVKTLDDLDTDGAFDHVHDSANEVCADGLMPTDHRLLALKNAGRMVEFLHEAVQARCNIVIAGATGSGKTTFARSLIERVPLNERLITIEDVHELVLPNHPNRVHMMYGGTRGRVTAMDCIAACMRLTPDRIFLAELRGAEAWEYLAALNTGHPGSITTTHANSAADTYDRLVTLIKQSPTGGQLDLNTIRDFLTHTVDIVLYYEHYRLTQVWYEPRRRTLATSNHGNLYG
ncbi:P-type DNA transfer ATPase VirB11 [Allopusillimonas ginsengisoli]|uniref:P-type DNA transfer ATPase VirB11 n=1 Tax=Allopusillimonas ginsengisoli TaxID=453575 RepID=UPI0039C1F7C9